MKLKCVFTLQAYKCGKLAEEGKFLPPDFKFTGLRSWDEADETVRQVRAGGRVRQVRAGGRVGGPNWAEI